MDRLALQGPFATPADLDAAVAELSQNIIRSIQPSDSIVKTVFELDDHRISDLLLTSHSGDQAANRLRRTFLDAFSSPFKDIQSDPAIALLHRLHRIVLELPQWLTIPKTTLELHDSFDAVVDAYLRLSAASTGALGSNTNALPNKRHAKQNSIDSAFTKVGAKTPQNPKQWEQLESTLRSRLKNMALAFAEFAQSADVSMDVRKKLVADWWRGAVPQDAADQSSLAAVFGPEEALGFLHQGLRDDKWPIVIARRGLKNLRGLCDKNPLLTSLIEKKLLQLREGYFPPSNQKQFLDSKYKIPLYEAELLDDVRIIYQIDCGGPTRTPNRETQFIRVYDITKDMDLAFWRKVAAQLDHKDPLYHQHCNERSMPRIKAQRASVIAPILRERSDSRPDLFLNESRGSSDKLSEETCLELHRILAIEKFIPFSQDLLHALVHRESGSFMFAMSSSERDVVSHDSSCLVLGRSGTGKTTVMLFKILAYELAARKETRHCRQLFLTQSAALADKVKEQYDILKQGLSNIEDDDLLARTQEPLMNETLDDLGDGRSKSVNSFPTKFSELKDEHFPLFLSFDELCNMIASDADMQFDPRDDVDLYSPTAVTYSRRCLVDYRYFLVNIWSRIGRKGIDPTLLFNEFMGVIKGTEASISSRLGYLDRESYENLSHRAYPTFANQRSVVYDLFEAYVRIRPPGSYDRPDRTHILLQALARRPRAEVQKIDFVYVDEVQDNLIVDTAVIRTLCRNPHGLFYAGDTAQTVSVGSSFRFNDLKAFLYRLERDEPLVKANLRPPVDPHFFSLSMNYRSHGGIIKPAAFILSALSSLFPHSIDQLDGELAMVPGPRPLFFTGRQESTPFDHFLNDESNAPIEFGSNQVIIVRDETSRQRLLKKIGTQSGMIMTLYSSKGQEFNDVLLYDFFADSTASASDWRFLLRSKLEPDSIEGSIPEVADRLHPILQSELKCLYVGMTRAREHVWFWDSGDKGDPFKKLLVDFGLAVAMEPWQAMPKFGVKSTAREWAARGKECFKHNDYTNAMFCFENAGLPWWRTVAEVYGERASADLLPTAGDNQAAKRRTKAFRSCAERLRESAVHAPSATDRRRLFFDAAQCCLKIGDREAAAHSFLDADAYDDAAWNYRLAGKFEKALSVIQSHKDTMDASLVQRIVSACRLVFARKGDLKTTRDLFDSPKALLEFLEDRDFQELRLSALRELRHHDDAAKLLVKESRPMDAITELLKSSDSNLRRTAADIVMTSLRANFAYGVVVKHHSPVVADLFKYSTQVNLRKEEQEEVDVMRAIINSEADELSALSTRCVDEGNLHFALLLADARLERMATTIRALTSCPPSHSITSLLQTCWDISRLVRKVFFMPNMLDMVPLRNTFGLTSPALDAQDAPTDEIVVQPHSLIYHMASKEAQLGRAMKRNNTVVIAIARAVDLVRTSLFHRFNKQLAPLVALLEAHKSCAPFQICLSRIFDGRCSRDRQCRLTHPQGTSAIDFNGRLHLHLLVLAILDIFVPPPDFKINDRKTMQREWLSRVFEVLFPASSKMGNISDVSRNLIPECDILINIVKSWAREFFCGQGRSSQYFITASLQYAMLATLLDYDNATTYFHQSGWGQQLDKRAHELAVERALLWCKRDEPQRHWQGIDFIRFVLSNKVERKYTMDLNTLIPFIEEAAIQLIFNNYCHWGYLFCGLTLPRSWIIRAFRYGGSRYPNYSSPGKFVGLLRDLLNYLNTGNGAEQLRFGVHRLYLESLETRSYAMTRLLRVLTLIGHNLWQGMKNDVLGIFRKLKSANQPIHASCRDYFNAQQWDDAVRALTLSMVDLGRSAMDDVVSIYNKWYTGRRYKYNNVQLILWDTRPNLMEQLQRKDSPSLLLHLTQRSDASTLPDAPQEASTAPDAQAGPPPSDTQEADSTEVEVDLGDGMKYTEVTEEQRKSARRIQVFFRRYLKRRGGGSGGPLFREYHALTQRAPATDKRMRVYYLHLRANMPLVLEDIVKLMDHCHDVKRSVNKGIAVKDHKYLDDLEARSSAIGNLIGELQKLHARLAASSTLHETCSLDDLRKEVTELVRLRGDVKLHCHSLPPDEAEHAGVQAVLHEQKFAAPPRPQVIRPSLNTNDEECDLETEVSF